MGNRSLRAFYIILRRQDFIEGMWSHRKALSKGMTRPDDAVERLLSLHQKPK